MSHGPSNKRALGHDHAIMGHHAKRLTGHLGLVKRATCDLAAGGLYTSPSSNTTITSLSPFTMTWDNTCLTDDPSSIDIYLYNSQHGLVHAWLAVPYAAGTYSDSLEASWWNNTQTTSLQLSIVDSDTPRFLTTSPAGPFFTVDLTTAVYSSVTAAAAATTATVSNIVSTSTGTSGGITITTQAASSSSGDSESIFQTVGLVSKSGGLTKGGIAAAVIVPLLVVAVAVAIYVRFARLREAEKRKRWSEHIDKRMSTLSTDWRAGALPGEKRGSVFSQGGSGAAARASFAGSEKRNTRASSFMGGENLHQARTNSTYGIENNMAGAGAMGNRIPRIPVASYQENAGNSPEMRQIGQGSRGSILNPNMSTISLPDGIPQGTRASRVSFAEGSAQPRMSRISFGDNLNLRPTQSNLSGGVAVAGGHSSRPSMSSQLRDQTTGASPERPSLDSYEAVSPSQTQGPFSVADADLRSFGSAAAAKTGKKSAAAVVLGALTGANKRDKEERAQLERQRTKEEAVQDWKQAEATRRSNDGIRDMEAVLMRRSKAMSQYSVNSASGAPDSARNNARSVYDAVNEDSVEELSVPKVQEPASARDGPGGVVRAASPMGMALPAAGLNPDELLAAYAAARARGNVGQSIENASSPISQTPSATHLRPVSTASAGDRNPFRASMAESDFSQYHDTHGNVEHGMAK